MQEHVAIDVNPGPIRLIRLISDYFPLLHPFAGPALRAPDPHPAVSPAICSARQPPPDPEGDSGDSSARGRGRGQLGRPGQDGVWVSRAPGLWGRAGGTVPQGQEQEELTCVPPPSAALGTEFTLPFDADNSALHCMAHRAKGLKPPASGSLDTYVKANLLPGASKASQLRTRTAGHAGAGLGRDVTYHGLTQDAGRRTPQWGRSRATGSGGRRLACPSDRGLQAGVRTPGCGRGAPAAAPAAAPAEAGVQPSPELQPVPGEAEAGPCIPTWGRKLSTRPAFGRRP